MRHDLSYTFQNRNMNSEAPDEQWPQPGGSFLSHHADCTSDGTGGLNTMGPSPASPGNARAASVSCIDKPEDEDAHHPARRHSYGQILKSSALIGGSSVINIGMGIVRTKAMAVLLGPSGFGLFGLYGSISDLAHSIAGMGVNSSGVRQIAAAVGSNSAERIARTASVLRRISLLLGCLGAALLALFSRRISTITFGTAQHATPICVLGLAVLLRLVSAGQSALIQGLRRISDLARINVIGAAAGTVSAITLVYWLGEDGIVLSLVAVAAATIVASWWYSRRVRLEPVTLSASQLAGEAGALLRLGFAFMASAIMTMGVACVIRIILLRKLGFGATGLYQSAWTLGGLYVGFILQAMGADFYPRLTASIDDYEECNRLVNEQMQIGLLLAGPGVIATLVFAPLVVGLFYSARFGPAVGVLRWICAGAMLQVVTWPMGFIIVAKARQGLFIATELAWSVVALILALVCTSRFGLVGAGIAFFGSYAFHVLLVYPIVHKLTGFRCSSANATTGVWFFSLTAVVVCALQVSQSYLSTLLGAAAFAVSILRSSRTLTELITWDQIPRPIRQLLSVIGYKRQSVFGQAEPQ